MVSHDRNIICCAHKLRIIMPTLYVLECRQIIVLESYVIFFFMTVTCLVQAL